MMRFLSRGNTIEPLKTLSDEAIVVDNISKIYKQDDREVKALDGVSFSVKSGEFFGIVGKSGSGKTSLLNILGAMEKQSSGRIAINGNTLSRLSERELTLLRRNDIATIYQSYNLIPVLNAFQNVELPMLLTGMAKEERYLRTKELLELVGLGERMDHVPEQLSGGEQQRVAIARALANKPGIIFADEPTGNLDKEVQSQVVDLLEDINRKSGTTLVLVTHDSDLALRADRIMELRDGKIVEIKEGNGKNLRKS